MKKHFLRRTVISILIALLLFPSFSVFADSGSFISEIKIAVGKNAVSELENGGYTAIYQNLNYAPGADKQIYMGYKTGNSGITGLLVSAEKKSSISVGSVTYTKLSSENLNAGTSGAPVYLYFTKDKKAGEPISALITFSKNPQNDISLPDFFGDGPVPIRTVDGKAADFESEIRDYELYFFMIRKTLCLPYISGIKTVDIKKEDSLLDKLVSTGCDYYIENPVSVSGNVSTYLCYNRTADISKAVRYVAVSDAASIGDVDFTSAGKLKCGGKADELYFTKSSKIGNPITDITLGAIMNKEFTLGDWAKSYFGGKTGTAASRLFSESAYIKLTNSNENYAQLPVKSFESGKEVSATGIYIILSKKGLKAENGLFANKDFNAVTEDNNYGTDGQVRDTEDSSIKKENEEIQDIGSENNETDAASGSAIGRGSLVVITVCLAIAVIITFVFVILIHRKKRKGGEV